MLRHLLVILATCCCSMAAWGQVSVDIKIEGVSGELSDNVLLFLSMQQQKDHPLLSAARLQRLHKKAPKEIASALQPFGYYRPQIDGQLQQSGAEQWQATYTINAGPPLPIAQLAFEYSGEIEHDPAFQPLLSTPPLKIGEPFNHTVYETFKAELSRLAAERGYFHGHFVAHRVEVDLDLYQARIQLHYKSGPRYHFGEVTLDQQVLNRGLLMRYIPFEQGSPYSIDALIGLQHALNDSDYFQTVEVTPGTPLAESLEVPVSVALTARKQNRYLLGLGYGTDTGARAKLGWEMPRVNPRGHRFASELKLTEIGHSLAAHYRVPVMNPRTDEIVYSAGIINTETDTSESTVRTIGSSLNRGRGHWRESLALNYQREKSVIGDQQDLSSLLMPGVNWSRTWGRGFIYTIDGLRFDIGLRGASDQLLSDTSFAQLQGGIKGVSSLGRRTRLISRGRLGSSWTNEFEQLPSSVRFFTGGSQSVRGYGYQTLGPTDAQGNVVGAKHLMVGSIELEQRLSEKWSIALFYDAGDAIDDFAEKLERGAGFGMRWQSPVGAVRFDIACAVSQESQPWRLHINIGPDL